MSEPRGDLTAVDFDTLPFQPVRAFSVSNCPAGTSRGAHAHREGQQLLVCTRGEVEVELRRGTRRHVRCLAGGPALLVPARVWARQRYLTADSTLLVLASRPYDPASYLAEAATDDRATSR